MPLTNRGARIAVEGRIKIKMNIPQKKARTFFVFGHQRKEDAFVRALELHGFQAVDTLNAADIILTDVDAQSRVYHSLHKIRAGKAFVFMYPHAAIPPVFLDGIIPANDYLQGVFVFSEGHRDVLESFQCATPSIVCGWSYSDIRRFRPCKSPRKVLFAPIHPNQSGYLPSEDKETNYQTLRKLLDLSSRGLIDLTVRHIQSAERNGIYISPYARYTSGQIEVNRAGNIHEYDLIVSRHTFAYNSVALGIPTLMMKDWATPKSGKDEDSLIYVKNWESYKSIMQYPLSLDIMNNDVNPEEMIKYACESDCLVKDWKERMIGSPFDPHKVVMEVSKYL